MIELKNVNIEFPVYNLKARTLKNKLLSFATGGYVSKDSNTVVVKALNDISLKLEEGDKLAILGHNGAGKSTLLRTLAGIYEPSSGTIDIRGKITSLISISLGINEEATGRENIFIRGALLGLNRKKILNYVDEIIEFSELGEFIDMPLRTYSSGMKMRLAFSIATSVESEIILMDEWLSVGDEDFKIKAEKRMQNIVNSSKILVIATHSKNLVNKICNKALLLEKGKIKQFGGVNDVSEQYFVR